MIEWHNPAERMPYRGEFVNVRVQAPGAETWEMKDIRWTDIGWHGKENRLSSYLTVLSWARRPDPPLHEQEEAYLIQQYKERITYRGIHDRADLYKIFRERREARL